MSVIDTYNWVNKNLVSNEIKFMNHGYSPSYSETERYAQPYEASLYYHLLSGLDTDNKTILDIGCGRGGGTDVYKSLFSFKEIHACDINEVSINFCRNNIDGVEFKVCSSESLEYPDGYFDIVTNLESAHLYSDLEKFHSEVYRILKPEGIFVYSDGNVKDRISNTLRSKFSQISYEDITRNVENACLSSLDIYRSNKYEGFNFLIDIYTRAYEKYVTNTWDYGIYVFKKGAE